MARYSGDVIKTKKTRQESLNKRNEKVIMFIISCKRRVSMKKMGVIVLFIVIGTMAFSKDRVTDSNQTRDVNEKVEIIENDKLGNWGVNSLKEEKSRSTH